MQKKFITQYIFLVLLASTGLSVYYFTRFHFIAGCLTGSAVLMMVLVWAGRRVIKRSANSIDKRIRDIILEKEV